MGIPGGTARLDPSVDDLRLLSTITMELMQKYVKEDAAIGLDDVHCQHSNLDMVSLLSVTTFAMSAAELLKMRNCP